MFKKNYKKVCEIPTGITTKIADSMEGRIEVVYDMQEEFDKPLLKKWYVEWWEEHNDEATDYSLEVVANTPEEVISIVRKEYPLSRKINIKLL